MGMSNLTDFWIDIYVGGIVLLSALMIYITYKRRGLYWASVPVIFTIYFLISESMVLGTHNYQYGTDVPLQVNLWQLFGMQPPGGAEACSQVSYGVPLAVVLMEAILLFSIMSLTDNFRPSRLLCPLMDGFIAAVIDLSLDPVAAVSMICNPDQTGEVLHDGLGIWMWFTSSTYPGQWFGIPLVNFAAWFLGAAAMSASVRWIATRRNVIELTHAKDLLKASFLALILCLVTGLLLEAVLFFFMGQFYNTPVSNTGRWIAFIVLFVGTAFVIWIHRGTFRPNPKSHLEQLMIPIFLFVYMLAALFLAGPWQNFTDQLILLGYCGALFGFYTSSPFVWRKILEKIREVRAS